MRKKEFEVLTHIERYDSLKSSKTDFMDLIITSKEYAYNSRKVLDILEL